MKPITEGAAFPQLTLQIRRDGAWQQTPSDELFAGRTVALFGLPGAFTPTCSASHVPRYVELQPLLKEHGVDEIVCVSVNDRFVMEAWQREQGADVLSFLADGNGTLSKALGLLVDKSDIGFGWRSWRYSMLVTDGIVTHTFIEPVQPGDPYEVSDADTMLDHLAPAAARPAAASAACAI